MHFNAVFGSSPNDNSNNTNIRNNNNNKKQTNTINMYSAWYFIYKKSYTALYSIASHSPIHTPDGGVDHAR